MISTENDKETKDEDEEDSEIEEEKDSLVNNIKISEVKVPINFDKKKSVEN